MISFMTLYPEWIVRHCEIKENTTKKTPIIKLNQLSYDILCQNKSAILKPNLTPYMLRGYKIIIDNSLEVGVCDIVTEEETE